MTEIQPFLREIPLFQEFSAESMGRMVDHSREKEFNPDEDIISYGRPGEVLGVILEGSAEVISGDEETAGQVLATFGPKNFFGEMSLLTGEPTTAQVRAKSRCRVLLIPHETVSLELISNPGVVRQLARTLTERLQRRETDESEQAKVERARRGARSTRSFRPVSQVVTSRVLVLNLGSSSLKYDFFDSAHLDLTFRGTVERIGQSDPAHKAYRQAGKTETTVTAPDHEAALKLVMDQLADPEGGAVQDLKNLTAVGHRVVHGGDKYSGSVVVDDDVIAEIRRCANLAPLHNPVNLAGIEACLKLLPDVPQVAVFDTAFHQTMPKHAFLYAIPHELYEKQSLRRYGFHGTSHKYVSLRAAAFLQRSSRALRMITCHMGNGASVAAIDHGRVIDTSMGLTPLEGLIMGTRCGDVDPGLVLHLCTAGGMSPEEVDKLLNKKSGLKGVSGVSNDMREVIEAAESGDPRALLAIQMYCYRVKKYIGSYTAALGGLDALVFTAGIGENSAWIRSRICQGLRHMGVSVDEKLNQNAAPKPHSAADISEKEAPVRILVVPTDEEGMIAKETTAALGQNRLAQTVRPEEIPVPINVSAHHVHLQPDHVEALYGAGSKLTFFKPLEQPGQFACKEQVNLIGPKGRVERVRILGPERKQTQVEISRTEEFKLGIDAPVRASGDLADSPGLILEGPKGTVDMKEGVICALRHIHVDPETALRMAVRDRDFVRIRVEGERSLIFGDVLVRVKPTYKLEMHVDTDEGNAAELTRGAAGFLDSIQSRRP